MNYNDKRKVLYASTLKDLFKQMEHLSKFAYVQASEIKYYEYENEPYQVLVMKKWLLKEKKDGTSKSKETA